MDRLYITKNIFLFFVILCENVKLVLLQAMAADVIRFSDNIVTNYLRQTSTILTNKFVGINFVDLFVSAAEDGNMTRNSTFLDRERIFSH